MRIIDYNTSKSLIFIYNNYQWHRTNFLLGIFTFEFCTNKKPTRFTFLLNFL